MKPIPEIVKEFVIEKCGRMPETDKEIDDYLDLINHAKEYQTALILESKFSKKFLKRFGVKTSEEVKKDNPFKNNL